MVAFHLATSCHTPAPEAAGQASGRRILDMPELSGGPVPAPSPPWAVILGPGRPLAFLNHPLPVAGGEVEVGPLAVIAEGPFRGEGMVGSEEGIDALFSAIEALPLVQQARMETNHFAATLLDIDIDADGLAEPVFVTLEFPLEGEVVRERFNPLTGEVERRVYEDGCCKRLITPRRITEFVTGEDGIEASSLTWSNPGGLGAPEAGVLLEETRTVEAWLRDRSVGEIDPLLPLISKVRVNYVTGTSVKETYGLYRHPVEIVDGDLVIKNVISEEGVVELSEAFLNDAVPKDPDRRLAGPLLEPVAGALWFRETVAPGAGLATLRANGYHLEMVREDLRTGVIRTIVRDLAHDGRTVSERHVEDLPGAGAVGFETRYHYRDDFHSGLVPAGTVTMAGGAVLAETRSTGFDPSSRRLEAREESRTGRIRTLVWDTRWESPVEISSLRRRTRVSFDRSGLSFTSETSGLSDGEILESSAGSFDQGGWSVGRTIWYRPGLPLRVETDSLNPFGRRLFTRAGGMESRVDYSADGSEVAVRTHVLDGALVKEESDFRWVDGARRARVVTFIDGKPYDRYESVTDADGRTVEDGIRNLPGLELRTTFRFDGDSGRVIRAQTIQNGKGRAIFEPAEPEMAEGGIMQAVKVTPAWGLERTDHHRLGSAGPVRTEFENGAEIVVEELFPGLPVARRVTRSDAGGLPVEMTSREPLDEPVAGLTADVLRRRDATSGRVVEERVVARGTDVAIRGDRDGKRVFFDLDDPVETPRYEVDPTGTRGIPMRIDGRLRDHVTRLFRTRREATLDLESIDLCGFFHLLAERRSYDRAGALLEVATKRLVPPDDLEEAGERLFGIADRQAGEFVARYRYAPGDWRREPLAIRISVPGDASKGEVVIRELVEARELSANPHLPDHLGRWTAWKVLEGASGAGLGEEIHDGRGQLAVAVMPKRNDHGEPAERIDFHPPPADLVIRRELEIGANRIALGMSGDLSSCHFVMTTARGDFDRPRLVLRDQQGRELQVAEAGEGGGLAFWPGDGERIQWLPGPDNAVAAASVRCDDAGCLIVAVPALCAAGFDLHEGMSAELVVESISGGAMECSGLQRLAASTGLPAPVAGDSIGVRRIAHSSGLVTVAPGASALKVPDGAPSAVDPYWNAEVQFQGATIAKVRPREEASNYPVLVIQDPSTTVPTPLYALVAESGEFLEYYQFVPGAESRLYTIAGGFRAPQVEIRRRGVIEDEAAPGFLATGEGYRIEQPLSRTSRFRNRISASIFKLGADRLARGMEPGTVPHPDPKSLHRATSQADVIAALPTLAGAVLPFRKVPWDDDEGEAGGLFEIPAGAAGWFTAARDPSIVTPLLPTSAGTVMEDFVDTVEEARLIECAIVAGETGVAAAILDFYWDKSRGGIEPLHSSYDPRNGASLRLEPKFRRPSESLRTASAQLAVAEAALVFAEVTGDPNSGILARNLLRLLLERFRAELPDHGPRGISEDFHLPRQRRLGLTLWADARHFRVDTNARALLALRRSVASGQDPEWASRAAVAIDELESWFRLRLLPWIEVEGIVPDELFEIQDLPNGSSALGVSRWTSARAWLTFLQAADAMGVPREQTREWLEALARVHGVNVEGVWGLDWSVALTRPDAISTELTAGFFHTARLLGHGRAADFSRRQLIAMGAGEGGALPVVVTSAAPDRRLPTGLDGSVHPLRDGSSWPVSWSSYRHLAGVAGPVSGRRLAATPPPEGREVPAFLQGISWFYLSILAWSLVVWTARVRGGRRAGSRGDSGRLVGDGVMAAAEKRWAERVLGMRAPPGAPHSRFANGPVEANFIMQLRAIHKLVLEWRRRENGMSPDDPELAERDDDPWLNGADEYVAMAALYMRHVIKAGLKDGFHRDDVLDDAEDSNHIWSRLVMFFSEYHSGLLTLLQLHGETKDPKDLREIDQQLFLLLDAAGMRPRGKPFDARLLFDFPADPEAFDLLLIQRPGVTLGELVVAAERKLGIPRRHFEAFVRRYKEFKVREKPYPVHPLVMEASKVLPHLLLVALLGVLWYNREIGGLPVLPFLGAALRDLVTSRALLWAVPLAAGYGLGMVAAAMNSRRYDAGMRTPHPAGEAAQVPPGKPDFLLPLIQPGRRWDPAWYERPGYALRGLGFLLLGLELMRLPTPGFAVFMILKGLLALLLIVEAGAILAPLAGTWLSMWLQERVTRGRRPWRLTRFLNRLNIPATRPASVIWQALVYHYGISVPTGSPWAFVRCILFYFGYASIFLFAGGYLFKEVLAGWFAATYQIGHDLRLLVGGLVFLNTMYLLRFGLFVLLAGISAALATYPVRMAAGLIAAGVAIAMLADGGWSAAVSDRPVLAWSLAALAIGLATFEEPILRLFKKRVMAGKGVPALDAYRSDDGRSLGIVYMSGDELGFGKLRPELLMDRVEVLRDRFGSSGLREVVRLLGDPDDGVLRACFSELRDVEVAADTTLWHPAQLVVAGAEPAIPAELGLNLRVGDAAGRDRLLGAWHARRWLVTMMSSAGHSQDTAINLVDIALRLDREGLAGRSVFYLICNKYDAREDNRPGQMDYRAGELGQREKLARLLEWAAPGSRAFSLNDWTPFGSKAGGLMAMDLVHEEALKLTNMVVLDRNATVHDLDALAADIGTALADPGVVIVVPGRGTTNTLTPIGQASRSMEEGHRELLKGVMLTGGEAGEALGTGWGNIQAIYYGRVQRAMMDANTRRLPLTSRERRGSTFNDRLEGMVGFGPHAVGISEDTWAVVQAAHNAVSLGLRVKFKRSTAMWHKIRETWSHADWFSAFPRWSGGLLQMMQDPLMQRIGDHGPHSVFAKEMQANNGRFFLSAPFALLSILSMPLAILLDASPFVQILIVLWNAGFVLNQVLTSLGLVAMLEATGYSRAAGLAGAAVAGLAVHASGACSPACGALAAVAGMVAGGFLAGLGRWLYLRGRDIILFGPQLVIFALGQLFRQSLEFVLSGAAADDAKGVDVAFRASTGPREDQPLARYASAVNLRSVVWIVGGLSMALNFLALTNLDFLNVLLLLPSLLFAVSCLAGPFLMSPRRGKSLGHGVVVPRLLGWIAGTAVLLLIAALVARGGKSAWAASGIAGACGVGMLFHALPFRRSPGEAVTGLARFDCELRRSFALSLLVLLWFLIVPVPGLLIFAAGDYHIAIGVTPFVTALGAILAGVLAVAMAGGVVEFLLHRRAVRLDARTRDSWSRFRSRVRPDLETAHLFALFTDLQTYLDQRAYGYAGRTLGMIERQLGAPRT